jgi:tRNA nucleotidyltransferase/poly(A) polymerase
VEERLPALPPRVREAVDRLRAAGIRAYVVGGAVRDALLGRPVRDFDLVCESDLASAARALPDAVPIGAHAPVLLLPAGDSGPRIEISEPRGAARSVHEDLALRDFTLNAIAYDPQRHALLDPLGGVADLAAGRLRAPDPERAVQEDPARILRGVRLERELGLTADLATERAFERHAHRLALVPGERLRDELWRLLPLPEPSNAIERMRRIGALASLLPELLRCVAIEQNRFHTEDVYRHTLHVCDLVAPDPLLRLAALLHDVAKPETRARLASGQFGFHRHDHAAAPHVGRVAERLRLSRRERRALAGLVRHHLLFPDRLVTRPALRRMLVRVGPDILSAVLELRRADFASRDPSGQAPPEWQRFLERLRDLDARGARPPRLAIGGRDVMRTLALPAGPEVGRWLARLRRRIQEKPDENERERLIAWLREAARKEADA